MGTIRFLRKYIIFLPAFLAVACSSSTEKKNFALDQWIREEGKVKVLATTAIVGSLVEMVGGEEIDLLILMGRDLDPHSYEMVKGDADKFKYADIVFSNGLFLEHSASMQAELKHHKRSIRLGDEVAKKYREEILFVNGQVDPHIWMDLSLWSKCIDPIVKALSAQDPEHAKKYEERGRKATLLLEKEDREVRTKMESIPVDKRYLVTSHDAFNYFGRRYLSLPTEMKSEEWRERVHAIQGLAPDEQISPLEILEIVEYILKRDICVIFPEANLSQDALKKVVDSCLRKGKKVSLCKETLYGDTLGGKTYIEMIHYNTDVLIEWLPGASCG
jgi:manganese/zinc/iron transport system substrate-binding protein